MGKDRTSIRAPKETLRRLHSRQEGKEPIYGVIDRLLDETVETTPLPEVLDEIDNYYDDIVSINCEVLPTPSNPDKLALTIHTPEAETLEDYPDLFKSGRHRVTVTTDNTKVTARITIVGTLDGPPGMDMNNSVVLYRNDTLKGIGPRSIDDGLEKLRDLLEGDET